MEATLAVQMYTVRDHTRTREGLVESLGKIRDIGYRAVQLSAVGAMDGDSPQVTAQEARHLLDDHGLRCLATHRSWDRLANQTQEEIEFHHVLGCDFAAIGGLPGRYGEHGVHGYSRFVKESEPVVADLKQAGIRFGYHNHAHEFERIGPGRRTLYDIFIEAGPDFMLEIDVYWAIHAGVNPVRLLERSSGRTPVIHLKDKEVVSGDGPVMAAVGEGNLDWNDILPACSRAGVEVYAVEQDICRRDSFDCLRSSYEYLKAHGLS